MSFIKEHIQKFEKEMTKNLPDEVFPDGELYFNHPDFGVMKYDKSFKSNLHLKELVNSIINSYDEELIKYEKVGADNARDIRTYFDFNRIDAVIEFIDWAGFNSVKKYIEEGNINNLLANYFITL